MSDNQEPDESIRVARLTDPHRALGAAVEYLQGDPTFDRQPFGTWSRILLGQISREHYAFALRERKPVGFVGFGRTTQDVIRRWEVDGQRPSNAECREGPYFVINAWKADDRAVSLAMKSWLARQHRDATALFAERFYPDGRSKIIRRYSPRADADLRTL